MDGVVVSMGIDGQLGVWFFMFLVNFVFNLWGFFWDGCFVMLEEQALVFIEDYWEMDEFWDIVEEKFWNYLDYLVKFWEVFGIEYVSEIDWDLAVKVIVQFEWMMVSYQFCFDQVVWVQQGWLIEEE